MDFKVDGVPFTITAEDVQARLRGSLPETVHQYSVTIGGTVWPVKQAFSVATGLSPDRFQSQTARRQLAKLGFTVNGEPTNAMPTPSVRSPRAARSFDIGSLVESDTVTASVQFTWLSTGNLHLDATRKPVFPPLPSAPGLYRYTFSNPAHGAGTRVYIGESSSLARRASNYRNATRENTNQRTSRRLHKEIVSHLDAGGSIEFSIATQVHLGIDDVPIDLRRSSARRLAENAAVLLAQLNPINIVLNVDAELPPTDDTDEG
jgi:hypothetical protein